MTVTSKYICRIYMTTTKHFCGIYIYMAATSWLKIIWCNQHDYWEGIPHK